MTYECTSCNSKYIVYLEEGCEGPIDCKHVRVPVPFTVSCDCGGFFRHIDWKDDRTLNPPHVGIPEAPHFRYPSKTQFKRLKDKACGRPVGFASWCTT